MTGQESRYDRIAEGYATYWSPVHRPATLRLLDEVAAHAAADAGADAAGGRRRILDVGCGTGALAVEAAARWADAEVSATDISAGMIAVAARTLAAAGEPGTRVRLTRAPADGLPFADEAFDLAMAAFVLQLVPSRARALREMRRVLRPGGRLAYVGWLAGAAPFAADRVWDEVLDDAGVERDPLGGHDDLASAEAAAAQLRAAGLSRVSARADILAHQFTPQAYVSFIARFDDADLVASLEPALRDAVTGELLARLRRLPQAELRLELPIVYATGVRAPRVRR